jgi:hypothetical protein
MQLLKGHRYRVTLEHLAAAHEGQPIYLTPLIFETVNHDDLFNVVDKVCAQIDLDRDEATSLAIGLKLLSEVALRCAKDPFYRDLFDALSIFINKIKTAQQNKNN